MLTNFEQRFAQELRGLSGDVGGGQGGTLFCLQTSESGTLDRTKLETHVLDTYKTENTSNAPGGDPWTEQEIIE
jgi:hypothetical protein